MTPPLRSFPTALAVLLAIALTSALASAQDASQPDDSLGQVLSTASYGLFPVEGSGISAHLQVSERAEGGSRLVLTAAAIDPGGTYRAALYEGDCGPDRPLVLELAPFGIGGDPYVSTTDTDLAFEEITGGDHFAYLFEGDRIDTPDTFGLDANVVACGEVGAGAIR